MLSQVLKLTLPTFLFMVFLPSSLFAVGEAEEVENLIRQALPLLVTAEESADSALQQLSPVDMIDVNLLNINADKFVEEQTQNNPEPLIQSLETIVNNSSSLVEDADEALAGAEALLDQSYSLIAEVGAENIDRDLRQALFDVDEGGVMEDTLDKVSSAQAKLSVANHIIDTLKGWKERQLPSEPNQDNVDSGGGIDLKKESKNLSLLKANSVTEFSGSLISYFIGILGTIALVVMIYGGLMWMFAMGNSGREEKAKEIVFWGALGVIVILSSYAVVNFVFEAAF